MITLVSMINLCFPHKKHFFYVVSWKGLLRTCLVSWLLLSILFLPKPLYAADCPAALLDLQNVMGHYNVITIDDLSTTAHIEGRTFVGGDLISTMSATFATRLRNVDAEESTVDIVGNLVSGNPLNVEAGSLHLGGGQNSRLINFNGGGTLVQDPTLATIDMAEILETASTELAQLSANYTATIPTDQPGPVRLTVTDTQSTAPAIFHLDGAAILENPLVQQIELLPYRAETVVINVAGTTIDWRFGNMIGNLINQNWQGNLVWNFYEATTIDLNGNSFRGALLAPYADIITAGTVDGSVAAKTLTTRAGVHLPSYEGNAGAACADPPLADLVVTKTGTPNPAIAGRPLLYTITVTNLGPDPAEALTVTDLLPADVTLRAMGANCLAQTTQVICSEASLAVNATAIFTIVVEIAATSALDSGSTDD